jgi:uncharacterized protein YjbJ (UPF0337 family)
MKNRDELDGKAEQVKGKAKQAWGDLTDNERLHDEGVADEAAGDVQTIDGSIRCRGGSTRAGGPTNCRASVRRFTGSPVRRGVFSRLASADRLLLYLQGSGRP